MTYPVPKDHNAIVLNLVSWHVQIWAAPAEFDPHDTPRRDVRIKDRLPAPKLSSRTSGGPAPSAVQIVAARTSSPCKVALAGPQQPRTRTWLDMSQADDRRVQARLLLRFCLGPSACVVMVLGGAVPP